MARRDKKAFLSVQCKEIEENNRMGKTRDLFKKIGDTKGIFSCLTVCDTTDYSLPGSSIHGIFQGRVLEWVAISFSRGSSRPRDWIQVSHTAGRHFTIWAIREATISCKDGLNIGQKWYGPNRRPVLSVYWKDCCWSWNSNTLASWCKEQTHWKIPWCWERLKVGGERDDRGWDGWMASPTQWTWVWVPSGGWWWTGRPGLLQSLESLRVGHDCVTELNWFHF